MMTKRNKKKLVWDTHTQLESDVRVYYIELWPSAVKTRKPDGEREKKRKRSENFIYASLLGSDSGASCQPNKHSKSRFGIWQKNDLYKNNLEMAVGKHLELNKRACFFLQHISHTVDTVG